jgi:uncharacterized membrane protein YeaQ/YmgE (transglycosylase-associated protein family)
MNIIAWIIVGGIAGWAAGQVMKSKQGLVGDIVVGVIGAFLGGFIFDVLNVAGEVDGLNIGSIFVAFIGAVVFLWVLRQLK